MQMCVMAACVSDTIYCNQDYVEFITVTTLRTKVHIFITDPCSDYGSNYQMGILHNQHYTYKKIQRQLQKYNKTKYNAFTNGIRVCSHVHFIITALK